MKIYRKFLVAALLTILIASATACDAIMADGGGGGVDGIQASGVVEAIEIVVAPELGGRVAEVLVDEGDKVQAGDPLFRLENEILDAQRRQAVAGHEAALANLETAHATVAATEAALGPANAAVEATKAALEGANAAVEVANAGLHTAQAGVEMAAVQFKIAMVAARFADQPTRATAWGQDLPNEFNLPAWYFQPAEVMSAAEAEIEAAQEALEIERSNFEAVIEDASYDDLQEAETRLAEAQAAFLVAVELKDRDIDQQEKGTLEDYVQAVYDAAKAELEAAQLDYEQMLSDQASSEVLEARARLAAAKERHEIAIDKFNALLTGEESLALQSAEAAQGQAETYVEQAEANIALAEANTAQVAANVSQAEASIAQVEANIVQAQTGVLQAEKAIAQAQAALDLVDIQMEKLTVCASVSGVVMTRNVEPGEIVQPGLAAMTLGQLDKLTITVYIPEDKYGQIKLGDSAQLSADSFPDETFEATVTRIANRAEYTPRNVQTQEDRQTTVYAIELSVHDPGGKLKPGMPTDVVFGD
ncbi:MAG: efflux RND transporter periplasmic adaptor subunit [Chloroflexi bacterium]|nr:efflux RND transporter periplasmic adaptor subunit [Chloroflexota bacterium]MBU1660793.1 efflux RND transporter periplasmic adaptor subunit [Chloroflexota bacterium]